MDKELRENIFVCGMSRSGTTLLTTILDSHPDVSMGYELLPTNLPTVDQMINILEEKIKQYQNEIVYICKDINASNLNNFSKFIKQCNRSNISPQELLNLLKSARHNDELSSSTNQLAFRVAISQLVVDQKRRKEKTVAQGFKINTPAFEEVHRLIPNSTFLYIIRDPRDVVASHFQRKFNRSVSQIIKAWRNYLEKFLKLQNKYPQQAYLVRYEDLVSQPDKYVKEIIEFCGLDEVTEVREFFRSKASIYKSGHVNLEELSRDFFTSSKGRWRKELSIDLVKEIEQLCGNLLEKFKYLKSNTLLNKLDRNIIQKKQKAFVPKRKFDQHKYSDLIQENREGRTNLTWHEAIVGTKAQGEAIMLVRHDIDHDIETALRLAQWEHQHNIRSTYCVLHTAWYYGEFEQGKYHHYDLMIDTCKKIQDLGHEINLHNNLVVLALQTGYDPFDILEQELEFFSLHGIPITGTSSHGDRLCRELGFFNCELFSESVYESKGGSRIVSWGGNQVVLGSRAMKEFGLVYEGYDLPRDIYITDSGGNLRMIHNTRGRGGIRRNQMKSDISFQQILGILTHPIWWVFDN
jgi:hypothetical protein